MSFLQNISSFSFKDTSSNLYFTWN